MKKCREIRLAAAGEIEIRAREGGGATLEAYATVFNRYSQDLGGFVEQVRPGAFAKTIQEGDIRALVNHNTDRLLGRSRAGEGTLRLAEDTLGLHYEVDLPDTRDAADVQALAERGDLTGSSFSFRALEDSWDLTEQEYPLRDLLQVCLYDVGPVTYPAYLATEEEQTSIAIRSLADHLDMPYRDVAAAANLRDLIKQRDDGDDGPDEQSTRAASMLALARRRLDFEALVGAE